MRLPEFKSDICDTESHGNDAHGHRNNILRFFVAYAKRNHCKIGDYKKMRYIQRDIKKGGEGERIQFDVKTNSNEE